ncbi:cohesin domain-containing protein [uncultured Desulfobacter sp.]|uniref:cohesin domain-containing protein n=1 Tax=uncultured Desulfobacter sp. TaxID=240139 RepID=UPI0029F5264E|nr:cohesin domain-containing protein [uncultured Desulfobacter sp.]
MAWIEEQENNKNQKFIYWAFCILLSIKLKFEKKEKFMGKKFLLAMAFILLLSCAPAYADMSLTIAPSQQTIGIGETAEVDIILSGLVDDPELTEFWVEISYDETILSFGGGTTSVEADDINFDPDRTGLINIEVLQITSNPQPYPEWTLATLTFSGVEVGTSLLELNTALSSFPTNDGVGLTIMTFNNSTITVVPIPGSCLLLLSSLGFIGLARRVKKQ